MFTATSKLALAKNARTLVLAGTLTLASFLPSVGVVFADGGASPSTPTATTLVLSAEDAFDVAPGTPLEGLTAVVVATEAGVPLMEEPAANAPVLQTMAHGTTVALQIDTKDTVYTDGGATRWWPVSLDGVGGWVNGQSLMSPEDFAALSADDAAAPASTSTAGTRVPFDYTGELDGAVAEVDADGDGLTMRAEPAADAEAVTSIPEGSIVNLRIADVDTVYDAAGTRWWPVEFEGHIGWVSGYYLIEPGAPKQTGDAPASTATTSSTTTPSSAPQQVDGTYAYNAGDWAVVRTADEGRTSVYASADAGAASNGEVPHMALVQIVAQAPNGWYEVRWDTVQGFISGDLLTAGTAPRSADSPTSPDPTPAAVSTATAASVPSEQLVVGDIATVNSESDAGINVREGAASDSARLGYLQDGATVNVLEGPETDAQGNVWYKVSGDDLEGWVRGDLLELASSTSTQTSASADTSDVAESGFIMPLTSYRFTQDYGCSNLGFYSYDPNWGCAVHDGVDLAAPQGTPLLAVESGEVVVAGWCDCGLGYYVEIDHGNGLHTIYGHMAQQPDVAVGDKVNRGDTIGQVGSTGLSTGPHVHFMVRQDGVAQDPKNFLPTIQTSTGN